MADRYRDALTARLIAVAGGVVVIDPDVAVTQADPEPEHTLGPLFRVEAGPVRWAVIPSGTADPAAPPDPVDGAGLLVDAVLVVRNLDASGQFVGLHREVSTAEANAGALTSHKFELKDALVSRGSLVYLSLLSVDNPGGVVAVRIAVVSGLTLIEGTP